MEYVDTPIASDPNPAANSSDPGRSWVSPGVSLRKRWLTGIGVALAAAIFFWIALADGQSMLVSTVIGFVFIGCFVWYLKSVAPAPFTIRLDVHGVSRIEQNGEAQTTGWDGIAKIKEEVFKNGTSVSLTLYKRVGERGLHRNWVVYRDDLPDFDALAAALRAGLPEGIPWIRERVHE
jgi:hypothetical protein